MEIIAASKARETANSRLNNAVLDKAALSPARRQLYEIFNEIEHMSNKGEFAIQISKCGRNNICTLKRLGYRHWMVGSDHVIYWR